MKNIMDNQMKYREIDKNSHQTIDVNDEIEYN
jgi:hypothetical protein